MSKKSKKRAKASSAPAITQELAASTGDLDVTRGYMDRFAFSSPQDPLLTEHGGVGFGLYEDLLRDDQVASCLQQRRMAITSRPWVVDPGADDAASKEAAEFIKEQLSNLSWDTITDRMLYGVFFGLSVAECMWERDGDRVILRDILVRHPGRFCFGTEKDLRLRTYTDHLEGQSLPSRKFWVFSTGMFHSDEPFGRGLAYWLYWPVFFKRGDLRAWLQAIDKFGAPTALGTYPNGAGDLEKRTLLQTLEAIHSRSGIIIPEGMRVDILQTATSAMSNVELYDRMNEAIAKVILSQTMTTESMGGQYKAEVHRDVRNDVIRADADMLCESFNKGPVAWLTEWNFPGAIPPRVRREIQEPENLDARSQRDERLGKIGYRPTLKQVQESYGGEWEEISTTDHPPAPGSSDNPQSTGAAFAESGVEDFEGDEQALIDVLDRDGLDGIAGSMDALIKPIMDRMAQLENPAEALRLVDELFPDLDTDTLQEALARRFFVAEMIGRSGAHVES